MDAAKSSNSVSAFLITTALLLTAAPTFAQTPAFNIQASGTNSTSITLIRDQPSPVSVASAGSSQITYTATTVYNDTTIKWLCLNPQPGGTLTNGCDNISGLMTPDQLNIQIGQNANSAFLTLQQHTATVTLTSSDNSQTATITVYYTPGNSTAGTLSASPASISATVAYQGNTTASFQLISNSATPVSFTLVNPNVSWITSVLTSSGTTSGQISSGNPVTVNVQLNGFGQAQTTLNATLQITYSGGSLSVPIAFGNGVSVGNTGGGTGTLSASQTTVNWTYSNGGNFPPNTFINVSSSSGSLPFGLSFSPTNSWFYAVSNSQTLPAQITIEPTTNIGSLATGSYTGYVNVTASDGSQLSIQLNLTVNGGVSNGLTISPNPVQLQAGLNSTTSVSQTVTVTSATGGTLTASVSGTGLSVSVSNSSLFANSPSAAVTVTGNPSGLGNGTYVGTLTITVGGVSQAVQVNFIVGTGSGNSGTGTSSGIAASPSSMTFVYQANSTVQQVFQQQQVYLGGQGSYTASATTQNGGNWLQLSTQSGTLPAPYFYIDANATGLAAGTYSGTVTFSNTTTNTTASVSVTLLVTGSVGIYTSPNDLVFSYIAGTTAATQFQDVNLLATDGSALPATAAVTNPAATPWLSISNGTANTGSSDVYAVTVNANNLANGTYTGTITFTSASAADSPLTMPVVLNVSGSSVTGTGGSGVLTLSQSALTFTPSVGGAAQTQQLSISASSATNFTASASTQSGNSTWLSISPAGSSVTNSSITVTANPAGLSAGTYTGTITLSTSSGTQNVNVTMIVGGSSTGGGNLSVAVNGGQVTSSPTLTFTANSLGASVNPQTITVTSASGSAGVTFMESVTGTNCGWVTGISTASTYTTSVMLNVGANTSGLASGTYNCTLVLTPTNGTAVNIPLTLTINGTPTISVAGSTSLTFSYPGGSAPASQTITVNGSSSTAATFTATASTAQGGNWLSVTPTTGSASSTTPQTLTVSVNPTGLAAGTYTGSIALTAGSGSSGSATINVQLTVTATGPTITSVVNGASFLGGAVAPGEFVSILGSNLGPLTPLGPSITASGTVATTQGQVQVFFNSTPAPLTYVSSTQINCTVPYEVSGLSTVSVTVMYQGNSSAATTLNVSNSAPGIFSATGTGTGQGAILNQNSTLNTGGNVAAKGSIIQIFMTGEGVTSPAGVDGAITANATTVPVLPIAVKIGGQPATIVFEGEAPGIVAGVLQLNVTIPATVGDGAQPVVVTIGNNSSQANLTVSVQ